MAETTSNGTVIVDIDASKAVTEILKYVDAINELKAKRKQLEAQIEKDTDTLGANSNKVLQARHEMEQYSANIKDLQGRLNSLRKATAADSAAQREHASLIQAGEEIIEQIKNKQINTIAKAIEANRILREAVRNVTDEEEEESEIRTRLNNAINSNTEYIRSNSDAYVQQKMNIGNY